jgi:hypothetical protein
MPETKRRLKVSPSLVISIFALVIAMSAGAYAATIAPKNSVVSKSIKNGQVKSKDVANNAINAKKIKDGQVGSAEVADGSLTGLDIGDGQVGTADIGDGQVGLTDLAAAAKTDLNDAATLGGLTVAQIVAASGGEYVQATHSGGATNILVTEAAAPTLATLAIPHAGKWLVSASIPVACTWDGTGSPDPEPDEGGLNQPYFFGTGKLLVGGTQVDAQFTTCEVEASGAIFIIPIVQGYRTIQFTRMITTTGPVNVTVKASRTDFTFGGANKVTVTSDDAIIQAITVQ